MLRAPGHPRPQRWLGVLALMAIVACGDPLEPDTATPETLPDEREPLSRDAHTATAASLYEDLLLERHPGDGGGRGEVIELLALAPGGAAEPRSTVPASSRARVRIRYHVGEHGISEGGVLFLQTSPFWNWQPAQSRAPHFDGYTTATTTADGVTLEAETLGEGLVGFTVRGRALAEGETVELVYGAGPAGAIVDRYAERESPIWLQVDADGDGIRGLVEDSPRVDIGPGPPAILMLRLPTTAEPGETVPVRVSILDAAGSTGLALAATVELESDGGLALASKLVLTPGDGGRGRVEARVRLPGVHRLRGQVRIDDPRAPGGVRELVTVSDPIVVREGVPRVLWGDLHGHSSLSDGTGTPEDYFLYARDVAGLDVAALTDHDHWGMRFLDAHPAMWDRIRRAVRAAHEPGHFVTLLGYEWTSWLHGHRHVLYFEDRGEVYSSIDRERRYETPDQLWDALRGQPALTFAHHSAGGAVSTNWHYPPDPELEPVTEIVSVHGSSEAPDSPRPIYSPVAGNFVRDALGRGYRLGFIGSGDGHDGHPGLTQLASPDRNAGLAAIFAPERSREAVLRALRERRVYATNGARIFLRTTLDERHEMGSAIVSRAAGRAHTLDIRIASPAPLDRVEVVRGADVAMRIDGEGLTEWSARLELSPLEPGEFVYVRAVQRNDGAAWSSPYFGVASPAAATAPDEPGR